MEISVISLLPNSYPKPAMSPEWAGVIVTALTVTGGAVWKLWTHPRRGNDGHAEGKEVGTASMTSAEQPKDVTDALTSVSPTQRDVHADIRRWLDQVLVPRLVRAGYQSSGMTLSVPMGGVDPLSEVEGRDLMGQADVLVNRVSDSALYQAFSPLLTGLVDGKFWEERDVRKDEIDSLWLEVEGEAHGRGTIPLRLKEAMADAVLAYQADAHMVSATGNAICKGVVDIRTRLAELDRGQ